MIQHSADESGGRRLDAVGALVDAVQRRLLSDAQHGHRDGQLLNQGAQRIERLDVGGPERVGQRDHDMVEARVDDSRVALGQP